MSNKQNRKVVITTLTMTGTADGGHKCWTDDTTCSLCGVDLGTHSITCKCQGCDDESWYEAADALGY